jgi:shikimate 5-dehydrogenase
MTTISIIGSGNIATAIGTRAARRGHTVELMSRNAAKAQVLADQIGHGATVGAFGATPAGDISHARSRTTTGSRPPRSSLVIELRQVVAQSRRPDRNFTVCR